MPKTINYESLFDKSLEAGIKRINTQLKEVDSVLKKIQSTAKASSIVKDGSGNELKLVTDQTKQLDNNIKLYNATIKQKNQLQQQEITLQAKKSAEIKKATQSLERERASIAKNTKAIRDRQRRLQAEIGSIERLRLTTNRLTALRDQLSTKHVNYAKRYNQLTVAIRRNNDALKQQQAATGMNTRNVGNYTSALGGAISMLKTYVGVFAAFRLVSNATKKIASFQKENSKLASILGTTRKSIGDLTEDSKALGASTAFTATQVTELQIELAKLGFTRDEILKSSEGILALAAATGTDLAESATLAGSTLRGFNLDAREMGRVVDVLAKSTSSSALDMSKLATALPIVGATAKNAGVSLERTVAILGKLADRGLDASSASTALRNIFLELSKQGLTWEGAMKKIEVAQDKNKVAMELFGKRGATAASIIAGLTDEIDGLELSLQKASGTAETMAEEQLDNLSGKITILGSKWEGLILNIDSGDGVITRVFGNFIDFLGRVIDGIQLVNMSMKELLYREGYEDAKNQFKTLGEVIEEEGLDKLTALNDELKVTKEDLSIWKDYVSELTAEQKMLNEQVFKINDVKQRKERDDRLKAIEFELNLADRNIVAKEQLIKFIADEIDLMNLSTDVIITYTDEIEDNTKKVKENEKAVEKLWGTYKDWLDLLNKKPELANIIKTKKELDDLIPTIMGIKKEVENVVPKAAVGSIEELNEAFGKLISGDMSFYKFSEVLQGFKDENGGLIDSFKELGSAVIAFGEQILAQRISQLDNEIEIQNQKIDEQQNLLQMEHDLKMEGLASDYTAEKEHLESLQSARDQAVRRREELQKKQELIDNAQQVSSIITAVAQIISGWSSIPLIGSILGMAAAGTMIAAFAASKAQVKNLAEGEVLIQGKGTEKSDDIPINVSKNESVITAEGSKVMPNTLKKLNAGADKLDIAETAMSELGLLGKWNPLMLSMNTGRQIDSNYFERKMMKELESQNKTLKDMLEYEKSKPQIIVQNGYMIEKTRSGTKIIKLNG